MNCKGFTLTEVLVTVIIVAILAVTAMPLYEKTIERSRLAEARTLMNRLQEAKWAAMDNMNCEKYSYESSEFCLKPPRLQHLGVAFMSSPTSSTAATGKTFTTKYFKYSVLGAAEQGEGGKDYYPNGICAKRTSGDYKDTVFFYYGLRRDGSSPVFLCSGSHCEDYGLSNSTSRFTCNL